jgi:hypothetical protein
MEVYPIILLLNALLLTFWLVFLVKKWKRNENRYAYIWSTHLYDQEEKPRDSYVVAFPLIPGTLHD